MPEESLKELGIQANSQSLQINPEIKLGKRKGKYKAPHMKRGQSHPNVLAQRERFRLQFCTGRKTGTPGAGRKKHTLKILMQDALERTVLIDGKQSELTAGEVIVQQRINEAMQDANFNPVALESTQLIFDRTEGKAKSIVETSGPDGGPIEVVETSVVLAKLFS
jgi:hypothetical protein